MAVPKENKDAYITHAKAGMPVFKEHGCMGGSDWGDDVPAGQYTDFYRAVQAKEGETIVFGWLVWPYRATRDAGMENVTADPRMQPDENPMPFDGKRMIYGGFETLMEYLSHPA